MQQVQRLGEVAGRVLDADDVRQLGQPRNKKARDLVVAGLIRSENLAKTPLDLSAGARHRRRWASLRQEPQPALAVCALDPGDHGGQKPAFRMQVR